MEPKKISFGFMKTKKAEKPVVAETRDYIECVEEKAIKVIGGEIVEEEKPLVIPMKPNTLITAERLREIAEKVEKDVEEDIKPQIKTEPSEEKPVENETLDQMAVRELLQEAKKEVKVENATLTVPIPAKVVLDGEKESTLEDYESVPIQDFGLAMLRGMGWTANKDASKYKQPELRPKGLGLGADKVIKEKQKKQSSKSSQDKEEELSIVKNAFVKITTGKYSGYYGKVVSLDEDNGRVMVEITIKKETVSLSEFMMEPVSRAEFDKQSRVIRDSGYSQRRWMMTPIQNPPPGTPAECYNEHQMRTRNVVERTIGVLKARWRCLLVHRVLHYKPETAGQIVNACVILHNIANAARLPHDELTEQEAQEERNGQMDEVIYDAHDRPAAARNRPLVEGRAARDRLVTRLWNQRAREE